MGNIYGIFHSYMGRIAQRVNDTAKDENEYEKICKELSLFWRSGNEKVLSPEAKAIWLEWKKENQNRNGINRDEISRW